MALQGFDSPRPAPRLPNQARQAQTPPRSTRDKTTGVFVNEKAANAWLKSDSKDANAHVQQMPSLHIITNFSKLNQPRIIEIPKLRTDDNTSIRERRRKLKTGGFKGRVDDLRSAEPGSGLSPSDRELMIGITIPGPPASKPRVVEAHIKPERLSRTPEIIITPADTQTPWKSPPRPQLRNRRKPTSSIYSRYPDGQISPSTAPPVPRLRDSHATSIATSSRCTSWTTDFSDEDTMNRGAGRPESMHSQRPILRRNSADTIAPKQRASGWWNSVLSPFLDHRGTMKSMRFPIEEEKLPEEDFRAGNWKIPRIQKRRPSYVHSIWADLTGRTIAPKPGKFFSDEKDPTYNEYPGVHRGEMVLSPTVVTAKSPEVLGSNEPVAETSRELDLGSPKGIDCLGNPSPEIVRVQGMGLAAEYFEAYWHDQNSVTPYFRCQNHTCIYGSKNGTGYHATSMDKPNGAGDDTGDTPEGGKALELHESNDKPGSDGVLEPKVNEDGSNDVNKSHFSHISDVTDIEEDNDPVSANSATRSISKSHPGSAVDPETSRDSSLGEQKPLPHPPESPEGVSGLAPAVMTPGLRSDYAEDRALPMRPLERAVATKEPEPQYAPPAGFTGPLHPVEGGHSFPDSPEHNKFPPREAAGGGMAGNTFTYYVYQGPNPTAVKEDRIRVDKRNDAEELNDAHPDTFIPSPPLSREPFRASGSRGLEDDRPIEASKEPSKIGKGLKDLFTSRKGRTKDQKKRRRMFCCIFFGLFLMVLTILIPVLLVTLPRNDMSVQTSWLNVTGYPPVPTGISTIVRPNAKTVNGCVEPPTMWSCALPKEQQAITAPNKPDQPNFRVEIRFQNGTNLTSNSTPSKRSEYGGLDVMQSLSHQILDRRDSFTSSLFSPNPAPPSEEDQLFLGNTTDNNTQPFAGEATPFYISFLDAEQLNSTSSSRRMAKRQTLSSSSANSTNATNPFPNLGDDIPAPDINEDGTAAAANLYPFPSAQPLMLYNRGRPDEHYGFYTYFDRSIFLKSASVDNITTVGVVPDDENGGSTEAEASLRCTWAQTRFLVQIWTNTQGAAKLLSNQTANYPSSSSTELPASTTASAAAAAQTTATGSDSSANDFSPPGSFPYPVTITMDRHGGNIDSKSIYCYGMDDREHVINAEKKFQLEERSFDGKLVNPAQGLFSNVNVSLADGGPGGIDGGSGGCSCQWLNFETS